jgi:PAS domain S-box-containing protein
MSEKLTYEELEQRIKALEKSESKLKQAEEDLRVNRILLRDVLDIVPAFICAKNFDGKFILVNKKLSDFYGSTVKAMTNVLHANLCENENELRAMLAADREVIESGKPKFIPEETMENPDGSITVLETYKIPFTALGEPAVLIASNDITKRKHVEAELIKANENLKQLVSSERLAYTGRVASGIAHEIRNPSTNVSLALEQLCDAFEPHGKQMKYVEIIQRNLARINYLISELQNCARPPEMMVKPHDIHKLLENVIDSVDAKIIAKEINIVRNYTSRGSIVKVDREHIERTFVNLVLNAIEAIPRKRGTITVTTECDEKYFMIKIQDTGKGIAPESIFKIFDPFFSSKPNGIGLGLATCYGVIVSHGGTIEVASEPSKGALFTVSLPL